MKRSSGGFVADLLDKANEFARISLQQISVSKKLLGTKVTVTRTSDDNKYKSVYGALYNSSLPGGSGKRTFDYVVLLNMNDMKKLYQMNTDTMEFYDNNNVLQMGDILTYVRSGREFKYKVTAVENWSDQEKILYKYTVTGLAETNISQNENCQNTSNGTGSRKEPKRNNCDGKISRSEFEL